MKNRNVARVRERSGRESNDKREGEESKIKKTNDKVGKAGAKKETRENNRNGKPRVLRRARKGGCKDISRTGNH